MPAFNFGDAVEDIANSTTVLTGLGRTFKLASNVYHGPTASIQEGRKSLFDTMDILEQYKNVMDDIHALRYIHDSLQDQADRLEKGTQLPFTMSLSLMKNKFTLGSRCIAFAVQAQKLHSRALRSSAKARSRNIEREVPDPAQSSRISDTWSMANHSRTTLSSESITEDLHEGIFDPTEAIQSGEAQIHDAHVLSDEDIQQAMCPNGSITSSASNTESQAAIPTKESDVASGGIADAERDSPTSPTVTLEHNPWALI